ncbi:MAG: efflux RND transporter periplasmic adaptor subunit, partial [Bacteriovoracaceae bacterium]|nr:efflux RND transporter periplasmic adaptor subunit [Bacteriovoracaceae bacterium]
APEKSEPKARLVSLFVDKVESEEVVLSVNTQGEVKPKTEIDLISRVSGQVVSISENFAEGAEFEPDSILIKIDDADYKFAVVSAESRLASAKVSLERELANSKIKKDQWKRKGSSAKPSDYALNKPQIAEARAQIRAAVADLKAAKLNVERTNIKVPFKGRVVLKDIGLGEYVSQGKVLGRVFSTDIVEVRLPLTDTQLTELNLPMGYMAEKNQGPVVNFKAYIGKKEHNWKGRIVRTNASIDQQTRLIYAIAQVEDPYGVSADNGNPFAVGLFASAEIASANSQTAFSLPRVALHNDDKVYVINEDSKLEIRTVDVLSTNKEKVLLASGVEVGEKVVTSTLPAAVDGMEVIALERNAVATIK